MLMYHYHCSIPSLPLRISVHELRSFRGIVMDYLRHFIMSCCVGWTSMTPLMPSCCKRRTGLALWSGRNGVGTSATPLLPKRTQQVFSSEFGHGSRKLARSTGIEHIPGRLLQMRCFSAGQLDSTSTWCARINTPWVMATRRHCNASTSGDAASGKLWMLCLHLCPFGR